MLLVRFAPALLGTLLMLAGPLDAQTAPTPSTANNNKATLTRVATTAKTSRTSVPVQRTAKSLDCSKQADAKGLHGSLRKHFMSTCKKS